MVSGLMAFAMGSATASASFLVVLPAVVTMPKHLETSFTFSMLMFSKLNCAPRWLSGILPFTTSPARPQRFEAPSLSSLPVPLMAFQRSGGLFDLTHQRRDGRNGRGQRTDIVGNAARRLAQNLLIQRFQDIDVAHLFFIAEPAVVDIRKAAGQGIDRMRSDQHRRRGRQTGTAARNTPRCRCRNNCTNTGSHSPCRLDDLPRNALVLIVIDDCRDRTLGPVHSICHTGGDFLLASVDFFP